MYINTIIVLLIICWISQSILSLRQYKEYKNNISDIKKHFSGFAGVGMAKSRFNLGMGSIVIIVVNNNDNILEFREMKGLSIFAKFKSINDYVGENLNHLESKAKSKRQSAAIKQAIDLIRKEQLSVQQ